MEQQNSKNTLICLIIIINYCLGFTLALRCYTCTYVAPDKDMSCVNNPASVSGRNVISCSKKYCTTFRQESIKPAGKVVSFNRDCQDKPQYLNEEQEDSTHKYYYRSCKSDLCNSGNGISSADASSSDGGAGENMIVPGRNIGLIIIPPKFLILIIILLYTLNINKILL